MSRTGRLSRADEDLAARILESAREARCRAAEVYIKTSMSRQIAWEPPLAEGGPAHVAVSRGVEAGIGLRIEDSEGRSGMSWCGGGPAGLEAPDSTFAGGLVPDALAAAQASAARGSPAGVGTSGARGSPGASGDDESLELVDPECLDRPDAALVEMVEAVGHEVASAAEGALDVDRILMTEARTSVRLVRLDGLGGSFDRTIVALSVALVPAATGAVAVTEERSACSLHDLDPLAVARDAILRGLPPRPASAPPAAPMDPKPRVVLAPRAAATLLAALAPWIIRGAVASTRPSAFSIVDDGRARGRPGSAPFDGSGAPTRRTLLLDRGRAVAQISPDSGPFQRHSYRDPPSAGPACLVLLPGQRREDRGGEAAAPTPEVRVHVIEVRTGGDLVVQVRRGDWDSGAVADGLYWTGPPSALVQAVSATLDEPGWYQVGLPVAAPSIVIAGLGPWRMPGTSD
jgi:hypothetical protein